MATANPASTPATATTEPNPPAQSAQTSATNEPTNESAPQAATPDPTSSQPSEPHSQIPTAAPAPDSASQPTTNPRLSTSSKPSTTKSTDPSTDATTMTPPTETRSEPTPKTPVLEKDPPDLDTATFDVNDDIPTPEDIKRVGELFVLDSKGQSRPFKELYMPVGDGPAPRQLVVFVRHFFCGNCQEYLRALSASITPDALLALSPPTFLTVIGCGRPELIDIYASASNCQFPIYADPTRKIYDILKLTRTLEMGQKPKYMQSNLFVSSVKSMWMGIRTGSGALKGGDFKQVGGEFLFEGGEGRVSWCHRMRNTRDHCEVEDLRRILGLDGDVSEPVIKPDESGQKNHVQDEAKKSLEGKEEKGRSRSKSNRKSWDRLRSLSRGVREEKERKKEEDTSLVGKAKVEV